MRLEPNLYRVGDDRVACYLLVTDAGATLIDAGLPRHRKDLRRTLAEAGLAEEDIRGIVLTHGDSDHIGFAEALRAEHGIPIFVHTADAARATGVEKPPKTALPPWRLGPLLGFVGVLLRRGARTRHPREVQQVTGGDVLDLPGSPEIVALPGHSPGSTAVYLPTASAVCVGDALTTKHVLTGEERVQIGPFSDDERQAAASIERLRQIDARYVLPGHGVPWRQGTAALVDAFERTERS